MLAPLSWLSEFVEIPRDATPESLAEAFVQVGFEVESIRKTGTDIHGPVVVGRVLEIEELTGHKKPIRFVTLDCGEKTSRGVICGARNFVVGDLVIVAKPGSMLPGDFKIASRTTYERLSDGMICSSRELGLGEDHSGIIVIPSGSAEVGADAREVLQAEDVIFEIAVNPDRGYALSIRGIARELAGALRTKFTDPAERLHTLGFKGKSSQDATHVRIDSGASIIHLQSLNEVESSAPTPLGIRLRLEKSGMRSISAVVDITNYVMLELGQPLHAFDKSKISGILTVRQARADEKVRTLDGADRELSNNCLVIADDKKVLAVAGTMGGESSEVSDSTQEIAIEAAHFDPNAVAKNARSLRLSTEASRRFERFVDPQLAELASKRAVELLLEITGASYIGSTSAGKIAETSEVQVHAASINALVGCEYSRGEIEEALTLVGCQVSGKGDLVTVTAPSWRPDLNRMADFAEEVARLHSYDRIPLSLPFARSASKPTSVLSLRQRRRRSVTSFLASRGFSETQNYPFSSDDFVKELGFTGERAKTFRLANPLSDEFPVLRTHILQSLLPTAVRNINRGNQSVAIFEIGSIFRATNGVPQTRILSTGNKPSPSEIEELLASVPAQPMMVAGVIAGPVELSGWWGKGRRGDWSDAISFANEIVELCGSKGVVLTSDFAPWHPGRCAEIRIGEKAVAHAGELHPRVVDFLGLPERSVAFAVLLDAIPESPVIHPGSLSTMPPAIQDVALVVDRKVSAESVRLALVEGAGELLERIELFDRYDKIGEGKVSLGFTLTFRAPDRTLTAEEVSALRLRATELARQRTGAELRS
ncbi:MAG: phenylalanine--tRNA ligase subunit beta [Candidatus Nanopelagicaceae bacterium]